MRVGRHHRVLASLASILAAAAVSAAAVDAASPAPGPSRVLRWERIATATGVPGLDSDSDSYSDSDWYDIAAAPDGTLVAVGIRWVGAYSKAAAWRSPDGLTWTEVVLPASVGDTDASAGGIVVGPTGFVAIGDAYDGQGRDVARIWTSPTGETWTPASAPPQAAGVTLNEIAWTSSGYLAIGYRYPFGGDALAWSSSDGDSWTREVIDTHGSEINARSLVVRPDGSVLVAGDVTRPVGDESARSRPRFWIRDDRGWRRHRTSLDHESLMLGGLHLIGERYYVGASDPRDGGFSGTYVSSDAISWERTTAFDGCSWAFSSFEQGLMTVCDGAVMTSPDGVTWTSTPEPAFLHAAVSEVLERPDGSLMAFGELTGEQPDHRLVTWVGTYD